MAGAISTKVETDGRIDFVKLEGTGNDYVYLDLRSAGPRPDLAWLSPELIRTLSDRRRGVGSDGVIVIAAGDEADEAARMFMWNADGSPSAMCGNGLRSLAWFVGRDSGRSEFVVRSAVGRHRARVLEMNAHSGRVEIEMGAPQFDAATIPFRPELVPGYAAAGGPHLEVPFQPPPAIQAEGLVFSTLSMGNPHCVIFVPDADRAPVAALGALLERHPAFPERTNVEFVSAEAGGLFQRTFERGSGETFSCGSGACAVHVAAVLLGRAPRKNRIRLLGGELELEWQGGLDDPAPVFLRGPVRETFRGVYSLS